MPLPTVEYPKYTTHLPSTGERVSYRPYTVREETVLLTAAQSGESEDMTNALNDLIYAATFETIDPAKITSYDAEYLFIQIRIKSVSPTVEKRFNVKGEPDDSCHKQMLLGINLENIGVQVYDSEADEHVKFDPKKHKTKEMIFLSDNLAIEMSHPGLNQLSEFEKHKADNPDSPDIESLNILIRKCVIAVYNGDEVYMRDDFTDDELGEFFDKLLTGSKEKMLDFIVNLPALRHVAVLECKQCGFRQEIVYEGLESFFV